MIDSALLKTCQLTQICFALGATLLTFGFAVFALDSLTLIGGGAIAAWQGWLGLGVSAVFCVVQQRRVGSGVQAWGVLAIALLVIGFSLWISGTFYDLSWDGQSYHQEAILQLNAGWNPFYQTLPRSVEHSIWLNHYPRTSWILAASLYQMTDRLETAKAFNWIFLVSSFFLSAGAIRILTALSKTQVTAIAALFALNPIAITQLFNFTIDGQATSLLLILGIMLCLVGAGVEDLFLFLLLAAFSAALLINLKFTTLGYTVIFISCLLGFLFYKNRKAFVQAGVGLILCILVSVAGFGFNPYISNTLNHRTPFYPLVGKDKIDIISDHIPVNFKGKNGIEKLVFSLFAQSDAKLNTIARLKVPFSVQRREILAVRNARVGGFGVWFSGALCLSILILGLCRFQISSLGWICVLAILVSTIINPEAWWARYAPQVWFLAPLTSLVGLLSRKALPHRKGLRICSYALILVLSLNCLFISAPEIFLAFQGRQIVQQQLAQLHGQQVTVRYGLFRGNRARLNEQGIRWQEVESEQSLPCQKPLKFFLSQTQICPVSKL